MTTEVTITAKPIKWEKIEESFWTDSEYGFTITEEADIDLDSRFAAFWGDGEIGAFATLEEAQSCCQEEINAWIKHVAVVHLQEGMPNEHDQPRGNNDERNRHL